MADQGMSGLLLLTGPELRYFSGFHTLFRQSPTRPWFLFVPIRGKPTAVIPEIDAALMRRTWIDDIRTRSAPNPVDDGLSLLRELLSLLTLLAAGWGHNHPVPGLCRLTRSCVRPRNDQQQASAERQRHEL